MNITVCSSGGGGNLQYLIDHQGIYKIIQVIVNKKCGAADRALAAGIPVTRSTTPSDIHNDVSSKTDLVALAGYMPIVSPESCAKLKIINTHPSLLPAYGGNGMYGVKVQEAVLANKEKYAGCTVHWVDAGIDTGKIIVQKRLETIPGESAWDLGGRIFKMEGPALVEAICSIAQNS